MELIRYKFNTCKKLTRAHRGMLKRLGVKKITVKEDIVYFSTGESQTVKSYFEKVGIELTETKPQDGKAKNSSRKSV